MAYSKQTFTLNQILTAAQMSQVEDNISDHDHSDSGVALVKIAVSSDDTTPGFLEDKVIGIVGITVDTTGGGGNEQIRVFVTAGGIIASRLASSAVETDKIDDSAVTTIKINDAAVTAAKILNGHVTVDKLDSAAVTQVKLATALQQNSTTIGPATIVEITFTGGTYNFMTGLGSTAYGNSTGGDTDGMSIAPHNDGAQANKIAFVNAQAGATETYFFQSRYVTASPPYDLGDGEVPLFIFVIIDNSTGDIVGVDIAADPPWANNGPTDIRAQRIDIETGKKFRTVRTSPITISDIKSGAATIQDLLDSNMVETEVEITAAFKNSDMNLVPHPWGNTDMTGKTLALMDPIDDSVIMKLMDLYTAGDDVAELFMGNYLRAGTPIPRAGPNGISQVRFVK